MHKCAVSYLVENLWIFFLIHLVNLYFFIYLNKQSHKLVTLDMFMKTIYIYVCVCVCVCLHACMLSHFSHVQLFVTLWTEAAKLLYPWDSPGKNTRVGCHALLYEIFPTQGSNSCLLQFLHWILYRWTARDGHVCVCVCALYMYIRMCMYDYIFTWLYIIMYACRYKYCILCTYVPYTYDLTADVRTCAPSSLIAETISMTWIGEKLC